MAGSAMPYRHLLVTLKQYRHFSLHELSSVLDLGHTSMVFLRKEDFFSEKYHTGVSQVQYG